MEKRPNWLIQRFTQVCYHTFCHVLTLWQEKRHWMWMNRLSRYNVYNCFYFCVFLCWRKELHFARKTYYKVKKSQSVIPTTAHFCENPLLQPPATCFYKKPHSFIFLKFDTLSFLACFFIFYQIHMSALWNLVYRVVQKNAPKIKILT